MMVTLGTGIGGAHPRRRAGPARPLRHRGGVRPHAGRARAATAASAATAGCWEQYASGNALVREARVAGRRPTRPIASDLLDAGRGRPGNAHRSADHRGRARGRPDGDASCSARSGSGSASASPTSPPPSTPARSSSAAASARPATCCSSRPATPSARQLTGRGYRPEARIVAAELGNDAGLIGAADLARVGAGTSAGATWSTRCAWRPYNVSDLKRRPSPRRRVVRAIDPDVLCLQEVPRRLFSGHRVAEFARRVRDDVVGAAPGQRRHDDPHLAARATCASRRHDRLRVAAARNAPAGMPSTRASARPVTAARGRHRCTSASTPTSASGTPARSSGASPAAGPSCCRRRPQRGGDRPGLGLRLAGRLRPVTERGPTLLRATPPPARCRSSPAASLEVLPHQPVRPRPGRPRGRLGPPARSGPTSTCGRCVARSASLSGPAVSGRLRARAASGPC